MFSLLFTTVTDIKEGIAAATDDKENKWEQIARIYRDYYGYMADCISYMLPECKDINDLVQDIFISLLTNNINVDFSDEVRIKSYLSIACKNKVNDYMKKNGGSTLEFTEFKYKTDICDPADDIISGEEYADLIKAIYSLPEDCRDACYLKFLHDLSNPEIAKILGIKTSAVSSRIFRGRRQLMNVHFKDLKK